MGEVWTNQPLEGPSGFSEEQAGQLPSAGAPSTLCLLCSTLTQHPLTWKLPKGSCKHLSHIKLFLSTKLSIAPVFLRIKPKAIVRLHLQGPTHLHPLDSSHLMSSYAHFPSHTPHTLSLRVFAHAVLSAWSALPCRQSPSLLLHAVQVSAEMPPPQNGFSQPPYLK